MFGLLILTSALAAISRFCVLVLDDICQCRWSSDCPQTPIRSTTSHPVSRTHRDKHGCAVSKKQCTQSSLSTNYCEASLGSTWEVTEGR